MPTFEQAFIPLNQVSQPKQIWICFHYLGGSASAFYSWKSKVPASIQLYAAQLPGRENRKHESFISDIDLLVEQYLNLLLTRNFETNFIFYGHSMGALIAYELLLKLEELCQLSAHQLFISACKAPHCIPKKNIQQFYSDDFLIKQLAIYGGTPAVILDDINFLNFFLPRLRADTCLLDSYFSPNLRKLECPIYAFGGYEDIYVPIDTITKWSQCTTSNFGQEFYEGGHFFVNKVQTELIRKIYNEASNLCIGVHEKAIVNNCGV